MLADTKAELPHSTHIDHSGMSTTPDFRYTIAFDPRTDIGPQAPSQLEALISSYPTLKIYTPSSPHFHSLKAVWNLEYASNEPIALIRPTTTSEISTVVTFCVTNNIPLVVRSGGHDVYGRALVHDAVILDIRELNSIVLADDKQTFTIGGGAQSGDIINLLDNHGLVTACALSSVIGHVGWASHGGFGPFASAFGLGVDQIIGAKIITADGVLREADSELLWGIKGAGGTFGVITEVKFKAYSLPKMLGGMLIFKFDEARKVVEGLQRMCSEGTVPSTLTIGCSFTKKGEMPMFGVLFSWASVDFEAGGHWLKKIKGLGTVIMDMVSETTIQKWNEMMPAKQSQYNSSRSFFISELSPKAVDILLTAATKVADGMDWGIGTLLVMGEAIKPQLTSSFVLRERFVFIHALAPVKDKERLPESFEWTNSILKKMKEPDLVKANYLAIMGPDLSVEECFGSEKFERLKALKRRVDPENVFRHVPAQLI